MGKTAKKKVNTSHDLQSLQASRTGGQIALRGYSYQFLYSCLLILTTADDSKEYQFEGLEDIDKIEYSSDNVSYTHIQLKCSELKKNASFMDDILKNFLEVYVLDPSRNFRLVYDFDVAKGNLSRLLESKLDQKSRSFWRKKIDEIRKHHLDWAWDKYDFDEFISHLSFEKIRNEDLEQEIEKALLQRYQIDTGNERQYINSIKVVCFEKMRDRGKVCLKDIDTLAASVKADISKGSINPASAWLQEIHFPENAGEASAAEDTSFFEGKKPTPADIAHGLPIMREVLCQDIRKSIDVNNVTVIRAASGQGKSTIALQAAYALRAEYKSYQLHYCAGAEDIGHIVEFIHTRIRMGERPLILIDNLDRQLAAWNGLAASLQSSGYKDYRILVTTRNSDWYLYAGDTSQLRSMKIIEPKLSEKEAREIYDRLRQKSMIASDVTSWKSAWGMVSDRKLLLEYIYLLTHGTMLTERISSQMKKLCNGPSGRVKAEILRRVCLADVCGIRLPLKKLLISIRDETDADPGELLHGMENEFLIHIDQEKDTIEGLHPVRSMHIVDYLYKDHPIEDTVVALIPVVDEEDLRALFFHLPEYRVDSEDFYQSVVEAVWDEDHLDRYIAILEGLFAGSARQYYQENRAIFDEANRCTSILLFATDTCPFVANREFGVEKISLLKDLYRMQPNNLNFQYVCQLEDILPAFDIHQTCLWKFCNALTDKMFTPHPIKLNSLTQRVQVAEWISSIGDSFSAESLPLEMIWKNREKYPPDTIANLFYVYYLQDKDTYSAFVSRNRDDVFAYLRQATQSVHISDGEAGGKKQIYVIYILGPEQTKEANDQSVSRLRFICRMLPYYDTYCSDAIRYKNEVEEFYNLPDDAKKLMSVDSVATVFHRRQVSLWTNAVIFNYQYSSFSEWLDYWMDMRACICQTEKNICGYIVKTIRDPAEKEESEAREAKPVYEPFGSNPVKLDRVSSEDRRKRRKLAEIGKLTSEYYQMVQREQSFPESNGIFGEKDVVSKAFSSIYSGYFKCMENVFSQIGNFLTSVENADNLLFVNTRDAASKLQPMQEYFEKIVPDPENRRKHTRLCEEESRALEDLAGCCAYFQEHAGSTSPYIDKYQIHTWYRKYLAQQLDNAREVLQPVSYDFAVSFPQRIYQEGSLRHYPVIVRFTDAELQDFGSTLSKAALDWFSFADVPYEYLVILIQKLDGRIARNAVKMSRFLFTDVKDQIEKEAKGEKTSETLHKPIWVSVTDEMLDCFERNFVLEEADSETKSMKAVEEIAGKLWMYSKYREMLTDPRDEKYRQKILAQIRGEIEKKIAAAAERLSNGDMEQVGEMYKKIVTEGERLQ